MDQITRICEMEAIFREASASLLQLSRALEDYAALQPRLARLEAYYTSSLWLSDYAADEAGCLPKDLPRGILSQDGIWTLLTTRTQLLQQMAELSQK